MALCPRGLREDLIREMHVHRDKLVSPSHRGIPYSHFGNKDDREIRSVPLVSDFQPLLVWLRRKGSMRMDLWDSSILLQEEARADHSCGRTTEVDDARND